MKTINLIHRPGPIEKRTKLHIRVDSRAGAHVHITLFANGAMCGRLCFGEQEYWDFRKALQVGASKTPHLANLRVTDREQSSHN